MNFLDNPFSTTTIALILFVIIVLRASLRVLPEWERAVVLRWDGFRGSRDLASSS
jgi:regulator of protease activity HflC (stomatin/prohibitin superfamily)